MNRRPFVYLTVSFCLGILLEHLLSVSFIALTAIAAAFLLFSLVFINKRTVSEIFLLILFVCLWVLFFKHCVSLPKGHINYEARYYRKKPIVLTGVVASDVQRRDFFRTKKLSFTLKVNGVQSQWGWRRKEGKVLVNIFADRPVAYGDELFLEGKLYMPFNFSSETKFDYKGYLERRGIKLILSVKKDAPVEVLRHHQGNLLMALSLKTRRALANLFEQNLSKSESAMMQAIVLGERSQIPKHITELFVQTGTAHILAISGQNVGIMAFLVFLILSAVPVSRKIKHILTILFLVFYAFLTGAQPPVVRATIMAVVLISGLLMERETDIINSLAFAAFILLLTNPFNLMDVSFQLSFISVVFIIVLYPKILKWYAVVPVDTGRQPWLFIGQSLAISLAAWVGVAGLIAFYFGIITPITILANFIVIPCMSILLALGLGFLLFGVIWPASTFVFAACVKVVINVMAAAVYLFAQVPGAYFYLPNVTFAQTVIYYLFLCFFLSIPSLLRLTKPPNYDTLNRMKIKISVLILAAVFFASNAYAFWIWTPETNRWINPKYDVKDTPAEQLDFALGLYNGKDYKKAINEFEKLIKFYPKAKEAAQAQYYIGLSNEEQSFLFQAFKAYQRVVEKYPFSDLIPKIIDKEYELGEKLMDGGQKRSGLLTAVAGDNYDVIEVFRAVIKNAPYGKWAAPAQYKIGLYLEGKGLFEEARDELEKVIEDYPASEWVKAARYQIAIVDSKRSTSAEYDQRTTQAAVDEFKEFAKTYPDAELSEKAQKEIGHLREKDAENNFLIGRFYEKQKDFDAAKLYYVALMQDFSDTSWAQKAEERIKYLDKKVKK